MESFYNYPIVEGVGIGGIKIGEKMDASNEIFPFLKKVHKESDKISLIYTYNDIITIYCKKDTKLIYKINVQKGYLGKFKNLIGIGDIFYDLISLKTELLFDDFDYVFYLENYRGICFESNSIDVSSIDLKILKIDFITVYDRTLDTDESIDNLVTVSTSNLFN
ncbi:hypothetical protein [Emticicia sp. BO119]|uniref:hypothetical protein n=1 Tax=Emticicia sp. BO119 TaxID=2757768 RepID=UPI0015F0BFD6|nr:hypothetical protein [Emticicia sp. BO119]MBA4854038.1 hypothetical protein [Emticicia sp. BO119]